MVTESNLLEFFNLMQRKAPSYFDLLTAENDVDFENAFEVLLEEAISHLESNSKNYMNLDEEGLTAVFAAKMTIPGLVVKQESNSNGHVDITIEASACFPSRKKLGEAKIYHGPAYHIKGLHQLVGRYSTGREKRGLILSYVRQKDIKDLIGKIREKMDEDLPEGQIEATTEHIFDWSFISKHTHTSGNEIEVCHIGFNMFFDS